MHGLSSPPLRQSPHTPTALSQYLHVTQEGAILTMIFPKGKNKNKQQQKEKLHQRFQKIRASNLIELSQS